MRRKTPDAEAAFEALYEIDNNAYAFQFSKSRSMSGLQIMFLTRIQTVFSGDGDALYIMKISMIWVAQLMDKYHQGATDFSDEIVELEKVAKRQKAYLRDDIEYMLQSTEKMLLLLQAANERLKKSTGEKLIIMESERLYQVQKEDLPKLENLLTQCFQRGPALS